MTATTNSFDLAKLGRVADDHYNDLLPAISQTYTGLDIVASGVYPVGDWRQTVNASYQTEAVPSGSFLGGFINGATMAASVSAQIGDWWYHTVDSNFYQVTNPTSGASFRIYRAGSATMPALIGVVATTSRVIIFDMTKQSPEMWMELVTDVTATPGQSLMGPHALSDVAFAGSRLYVSSSVSGLREVDFADDAGVSYHSSAASGVEGNYAGTIAQRNDGSGFTGDAAGVIVNAVVNAVAALVRSGETTTNDAGVLIPTVLVGTDGGVSQIDADGSVWDLTRTSGAQNIHSVAFNADGPDILFAGFDGGTSAKAFHHAGVLTADKTAADFVSITGVTRFLTAEDGAADEALPPFSPKVSTLDDVKVEDSAGDNEFAIAHPFGLCRYQFNESTPLASLGAYIRAASNTGWMVGDVQTAIAADTGNTNLISNGTFDSDTVWTKGTGWTIANGVASHSGGAGNLQQTITVTEGKTYAITFTVSNYSAGAVSPNLVGGGTVAGTARSANGTYTELLTAISGTNALYINGDASFVGSIDNVFVREAVGDERITNGDFATDTVWTKGTGWTIGSGVATGDGTATELSQSATLTVGKTYAVTFTVTSYIGGAVRPRLTGGTLVLGTSVSSTGTFTQYLTAVTGNNGFEFTGLGGFNGSIDNVRVRETLVNDGTFDTDVPANTAGTYWLTSNDGASVTGGVATWDGTQTVAADCASADAPLLPGKVYKIEYTVTRTAGTLRVVIFDGTSNNGVARTASGTYTEYRVNNASDPRSFALRGENTFVGSIDNVSIVEVLPDYSGNANHFNIIGELGQVAQTGGEIAGLTGFSATDYAESEAGADGIGAGDFSFSCVVDIDSNANNNAIFHRTEFDGVSEFTSDIRIYKTPSELLVFESGNGSAITSASAYTGLHHIVLRRTATAVEAFVDGVSVGTATDTEDLTNANAVIRLGNQSALGAAWEGTIYNFRQSLTAPTDAQIAKMARDDLAAVRGLCTLSGTSDAVTSLTYDSKRNRVHTATSGGVSVFNGLTRVDSYTGDDAVAAYDDATIVNNAGDTDIAKPAINLRVGVSTEETDAVTSTTGTFTPTFVPQTGAFGSITYAQQLGHYVRTGRKVEFELIIETSALTVGSASGALYIEGLPFTQHPTYQATLPCGYANNWGTLFPMYMLGQPSTTRGSLTTQNAIGTGHAILTVANMVAGTSDAHLTYISGTFYTDD